VFILGDPVDAEQVVVGYGEENVAAWAGVVITAVSSEGGCEPAMALSNDSEVFWESPSYQPWWQVEFQCPVVIGAVQFCGTWTRKMNDDDDDDDEVVHEHITGEFHDQGTMLENDIID
jgi:hypothetical protein